MGIKRFERLSWILACRKGDGSALVSSSSSTVIYLVAYCSPSVVFPFTGVTSDFPIFDIEGGAKSDLRFAPLGVLVFGVNPSNLSRLIYLTILYPIP